MLHLAHMWHSRSDARERFPQKRNANWHRRAKPLGARWSRSVHAESFDIGFCSRRRSRCRRSLRRLDAVMAAARPLPVHLRDPFLHAVAHALSERNVIGPGTVHQVCRELQRQFFDPPDLSRSNDTSKYR